MKTMKGIIAAMALSLSISASAQSIHFIAFYNSLDPTIGVSCEKDFANVYSMVGVLAEYLGYEDHLYQYYGNDCSKENLMKILNEFSCGPKDIIFFYYSGHGVHAAADAANLPQMCLKYEGYQQANFVPVRVVKEMLSKKNSTLNLIVTDCCNNIADWVSAKGVFSDKGSSRPVIREPDARNYRKLLLDKRGTVIMTSSKKGQTSSCTKEYGGSFTIAFLEMLDAVGVGDITPDWNQFTSSIKKETLKRTMNTQEPYFEFYFNDGPAPVINQPGGGSVNTTQFETPDRAKKFFSNLLDDRNSLNDKLNIADNAKEILFTRNAKVRNVGRDLTTSIGIEDIDTFLNRVCMNRRIRSIHVVSQAADERTGKINYLVVQEIYSE